MAGTEQIPLRQRLCRGQECGAVFYVCRSCDRGQRYCSERCRDKTRRQQRRAANRRHQLSAEGRLDHRDRQREYRRRLGALRVTDQRSDATAVFSTLLPPIWTPPESCGGQVFCRVCGRTGTLIDPFTG